MMTNNIPPLTSVEKIINDSLDILDTAKDIPQIDNAEIEHYHKECRQIPELIQDGRLKIAVVGAIKSGKSTFVNSLAGKELVQRGAGVVTSITTRIRKGKKNQASLFFKSWDEINVQLQNALQMFPANADNDQMQGEGRFDIRRKKDREHLENAYQSIVHDFLAIDDQIRPEALLMRHALKGFDACKDQVQADESTTCFSSSQFDNHKLYTSDPDKAFYVKDACLDVYGKTIDPNVEIADCQGADSTDPAQLLQVLNYLEAANLIIYCVSSRTGLRQADIMFLRRIKSLGRLDNIIFVNNCDLSEHENIDDLIKIETGIRDNLEFLEIQPQIFSFSALYNLFSKRSAKLNPKDQRRMELWDLEKKLVEYCNQHSEEFNKLFRQVIEKDQHRLLVSNHLKRISMILSHLEEQARITIELLSSDKSKEENARNSLKILLQNASRLEAIVANSIDGAAEGLRDEIRLNIAGFFEGDSQEILPHVQDFIKSIQIDVEKYRSMVKETGFQKILYFLFQDVKRELDLYSVETVRPQIHQFAKIQEARISSYFQSLFDSYQVDIAAGSYHNIGRSESDPSQGGVQESIDLDTIKKILGIQLAHVIFEAQYTPKMRIDIFTDFGLQTLVQIAKSVFNKKKSISFSPGLDKAVLKIKQENLKSVTRQFAQYRLDLEQNYFTPLIDASVRNFKEKIARRFNRYKTYREEMDALISMRYSEKEDQKAKILALKDRIQRTVKAIGEVGEIQ